MQFLLVAGVMLAVSSAATISLEDLEFYAWKLKFGKVYSSAEEEAQRKGAWLNNRKQVLVHNMLADQGIKSFRLGMTFFADMDNKEYRNDHTLGCVRSSNSSMPRRGSTYLPLSGDIQLPTTVDWRDQGYVTDVKNQGGCGSCWTFSTAGALEGQHFRKTGELVSLSEQQLVDCSRHYGAEGCHGGWMDQAFHYIKDNGGLDTDESYPYEATEGDCRFDPATVGATCTGWTDLGGTEAELQEAVATIGPVSVAIDYSHASFQHYQSGVYDEPLCSQSVLLHAVLVVGYGTTEDGLDYWLVKNSWGLSWGDEGYIMMSRNKNNQCGIATYATYPLV